MPRRWPPEPCPMCGRTFQPGKSSTPGGKQITCSRSCGQKLRANQEGRTASWRQHTCEACGSEFSRRKGGKDSLRCCSRACGFELQRRELAARPRKAPAPRREYSCSGCGKRRADDERWLKWCSYRCQVDGIGERVKSLYRLACEVGGSGAGWRALLVGYLRERDGDRCSICHRGIRFDLPAGPRGDDRGPSIDHIEPRSLGGSDDLTNLRLAHWGCNRRRKTGLAGEAVQLVLIG